VSIECTRCGTCCVAPDIAALDKPLGVRCRHLTADNLCAIYERRPEICRAYRPDELCQRIQAPTLEERAARYLEIFQLSDEAARASRHSSMRSARREPSPPTRSPDASEEEPGDRPHVDARVQ
jgi:hypothetical protein